MQSSNPQCPGLPPLPKLPAKEMAGPTPWSNWVIPGRVIAGAYPASLDDAETERILSTLLELGINTFVCLQAEVNINTPESAWRANHGLRPYIKDAQKILSRAHETGNPRITQHKIDFLHLPIIDGSVTTDGAMNRLAEDCMDRVLKGEKLYIHCWGGHGRTGTLVAVMLGRLYNLPYTSALRYTQSFHDSRVYPQGVRSPQTPVQRAQVRRLLASQSAVASSAPASIMTSNAAPARPLVSPPASTPVVAAAPQAAAAGYALQKPASTLLSAARSLIPAAAAAAESRGGQVPPSPSRTRPNNVTSAGLGGRYGSSPTAKGEAHRTSAGTAAASIVDRLAADFTRLQAPGGVASALGARAPVSAYVLAQR